MHERENKNRSSFSFSGTVVAESRFAKSTNKSSYSLLGTLLYVDLVSYQKIMCGSSGLQVNLIISFF